MAAEDGTPYRHGVLHIIFIILSFLISILNLIFGFFQYAGFGFFSDTLRDTNTKFVTDAFPDISLPILGLIVYAFQLPWTIYNITLIWREGLNAYLYMSPDPLPWIVNLSFIINCCLNIAWYFLWDRRLLAAEIGVLAAASIFSIVSWAIACHTFFHRVCELEKLRKHVDIHLNRMFVHNGLSMFMAWFICTTCQHASVLAVHETKAILDPDASSMSLGLMAFFIGVTIFVQDYWTNRYFHYCFANYFVWIGILIPMVVKFDKDNRNHILALVMLIFVGVFLLVKLIRFCCSTPKKPCELDAIQVAKTNNVIQVSDTVVVPSTKVGILDEPVVVSEPACKACEAHKPVQTETPSCGCQAAQSHPQQQYSGCGGCQAAQMKKKKMAKQKKCQKKKSKKVVRDDTSSSDSDIDGEINLAAPRNCNGPTVGNYRIVETSAPCEYFSTEPKAAYQPVEVLNSQTQNYAVPVHAARHLQSEDLIVPQKAQLLYNQGSATVPYQQPITRSQPIYNSGPVTIENILDPRQLSMNALNNLSGTPMGIIGLPKTSVPQAQPQPVAAAPTCRDMYGSCGGGSILLNQPTNSTYGSVPAIMPAQSQQRCYCGSERM